MHSAHRDRNRERDRDRDDGDDDACSVCGGPACSCAAGPDSSSRKPPLKIKLTLSSKPGSSSHSHSLSRPASRKDHRPDTRVGAANGGRPLASQARASSSSAYKPQKNRMSAGTGSSTKKKAVHGHFALDPHARLQNPRGRPQPPARVQPITQYPANHKPSYSSANVKATPASNNTKNGAARRHNSSAAAGRKGYRDPYAQDTDTNDDASDAYPTFVSAMSSTEDDDDEEDEMEQDGGNDSDESSELTDPDDFSVQAEEERFIIADEKARVRRELMGDGGDPSPTARKKFDWQIIPRKGSNAGSSAGAAALDETDSDSDSSDDEQEDEDEELEDDVEPDGQGRGRTASVALSADRYWSSSEDDFDAAVFFASLDSDAENGGGGGGARSDGDSTSTASELGVQSLQQQAGLVTHVGGSSEHLPIVTQDMHGLLVFGDAKDPALDLAFDIPSVPPTAQQSPNPHVDDSTESEGDDAMDVDDDAGNETDDDDDLGIESDGETTDEMCDEELMVRAPTPPSAGVNPLSTLHTPSTAPGSRRSRKQQLKDAALARLQQSPKPADILQRKRAASIARSMSSNGTTSPSVASSARMFKMPPMGRFDSPSAVKVVIVDGTTKDIPSPFARRLRRERVNRVRFPKLRRQQSPSPLLSGGEFSEDSLYSALHAGPSSSHQFIELHDVLDTAILEDDEDEQPEPEPSSQQLVSASESDAPGSANDARSLSRWDRIPMNTFRRTRADVSMPSMNMTMSLPVGVGAGYGLKSSSAWWEADVKKRERTASLLALSPILFGSDDFRGNHAHASSQLKIHRDKERRKRKSKTVDSASVKPLKRPSHAQRASSLVNVPPLHL